MDNIVQENVPHEEALYKDVCGIIEGVRRRVATYMNAEVCMTNWYIGKRIKEDVLYNQRADYGKQIVKNLSDKLVKKYGNGWGYEKIKHCLRSAETFSEDEIRYAVRTQLTWTLGSDFTFVARQKRITVDSIDYKLDLLFFHRELRRLVAIDLKLGKFKPEYEGQMLLYLRYLNKNERKEWEESPIGLILCSEGNTEHVEYLMLDKNSPIKVAQYYTQLPDKKLLAEKFKKAIAIAKENYQERKKEKEIE